MTTKDANTPVERKRRLNVWDHRREALDCVNVAIAHLRRIRGDVNAVDAMKCLRQVREKVMGVGKDRR